MNKFNKFLEYAFTNKYYKSIYINDITIKLDKNPWNYHEVSFQHKNSEIYHKGLQSKKKRSQVNFLILQFNTNPSEELFNKICNLIKVDTTKVLRARRTLSSLSDEGKKVIKDKLVKLESAYPDIDPSIIKLQQDLKEVKDKMVKIKHLVSEGEEFVKLGEVPSELKKVQYGYDELRKFGHYAQVLGEYIEKLKTNSI